MNSEIYFPREGKSFGQTSDGSFEDTIKKLGDIDVNIIYKTEISLTTESIADALSVTDSGDEKIGIVFIADALKENSREEAERFFEGLGIVGKLKYTEADSIDPLSSGDEEDDGDKTKTKKEKKKKKNKKNKKNKKKKKNDLQSIDGAELTFVDKKCFAYSVEYNGKLLVLLPEPDAVNNSFGTLLYTIADSVMEPYRKEPFWKRFIPCAGDRPLDVVRKIILILAICTFVVSSYMLINILVVQPAVNDKLNNDIRDLYVSTIEGEETSGTVTKKKTDGSEGTLADFSQLLAENPDTIGWIKMPDTNIDYVVVKPTEAEGSEYYLYRDFYGNDSGYGTVFMDYRSTLDSANLILHGHHMQDGRMFADLKEFSDLSYYKKRPTFTFNTIYEKAKWKIISIFKTNTLESQGDFFNYLRGDFSKDNGNYEFLNFVYELRERSIIDCPVSVNEYDTLCTLSTCTYDFPDFRFVIVARKVREGEDAKVDVSKAKYNPDPLYPDVWYNNYGGTKPEVTTFADAFNKKKIDWYDGTRKDFNKKYDEQLQQVLIEGKKNAHKMLDDFVKSRNYNEENKKQVDNLVTQYKKLIDDAPDATEVNRLYNEVVQKITKIKTTEQLEKDAEESKKKADEESSKQAEKDLKNKKETAIVEMTNSIAGNVYRTTQAQQVKDIIATYTQYINSAKTIEDVENYQKKGTERLKKIKTDDQLAAEEEQREADAKKKAEEEAKKKAEQQAANEQAAKALKTAKSNAVKEIDSYVSVDDYSGENREKIEGLKSYYKAVINEAGSADEVSNLLSGFKNEADQVPTGNTEESVPEEQSNTESGTEDNGDEGGESTEE